MTSALVAACTRLVLYQRLSNFTLGECKYTVLLDGAATDARYHASSRRGARTYQDVLQRSTNLDTTATENIRLIGAGEDDPPRAEEFYERKTLSSPQVIISRPPFLDDETSSDYLGRPSTWFQKHQRSSRGTTVLTSRQSEHLISVNAAKPLEAKGEGHQAQRRKVTAHVQEPAIDWGAGRSNSAVKYGVEPWS